MNKYARLLFFVLFFSGANQYCAHAGFRWTQAIALHKQCVEICELDADPSSQCMQVCDHRLDINLVNGECDSLPGESAKCRRLVKSILARCQISPMSSCAERLRDFIDSGKGLDVLKNCYEASFDEDKKFAYEAYDKDLDEFRNLFKSRIPQRRS